jgi:pimeloyl-ACP methyl ester carboxylesterase
MNRRDFTKVALGAAVIGVPHRTKRIRNVVLVHGAYADGSSWGDVIVRLQAAGLTVTAVQNPLTSLADDVAATNRILDRQDGPTLLVAHSWGGTVISEAGLHPNVAALAYVSARAPEAGEDYAALSAMFPTPPASAGIVHQGGFAWLGEQAFLDDFANGADRAKARMLYAVQGRISDTLFASRTTVAAWRSRPVSYLVTTEDRTTAPELQHFLAGRMAARKTEVASGHLSMVTHPEQVARFLCEAGGS